MNTYLQLRVDIGVSYEELKNNNSGVAKQIAVSTGSIKEFCMIDIINFFK